MMPFTPTWLVKGVPTLLACVVLLVGMPAQAVQETGLPDWPAVRTPKENWAQAALIAKTPEWSAWLAARAAETQAWIKRSPEDPTRPVGWLQDYVDAATGKFLYWSPLSPAPSDPGSKAYAAWAAKLRIYNVEQILQAARLYRLTGNTVYLDWATGQLDSYAQNYNALPLQTWNGQARLFTQSLDEAVYAFTLLDAVRLLRPSVKPEDLQRWRDGLFLPMAELLKPSVKGHDNISLWIVCALSAIADEFQVAALNEFALTGSRGLQSILAQGVSADGFWHEMSLPYQDYVVQGLGNWLYAVGIRPANALVSRQLWSNIGATTRRLMLSPLIVRFTDNDAPAVNDTQGARRIPNVELWSKQWRVLPTPVGLNAVRNVQSWETLLDPAPTDVPQPELPAVSSQVVSGLDSVVLNAKGWQALIRYGEKAASHAHQDALTYDLKFDRSWIFRDQGTVGYGSPLHANYFRRAHADAAPLIDRDGQTPWPSEGRVVNFDSAGNTVKVEHPSYYKGHAVSRELHIDDTGFSDTVTFRLKGSTPYPVGLVFNTRCLPSYGDAAVAQAEDTLKKTGPFRYWTQRAQYAIGSRVEIRLDCGGRKFTLAFDSADLATLFTATTPDTGGHQSRGFYLETRPVLNATINLHIRAADG